MFDALSVSELYFFLGGATVVLIYFAVYALVRGIQILRGGI